MTCSQNTTNPRFALEASSGLLSLAISVLTGLPESRLCCNALSREGEGATTILAPQAPRCTRPLLWGFRALTRPPVAVRRIPRVGRPAFDPRPLRRRYRLAESVGEP
jgi:hypothetical protein